MALVDKASVAALQLRDTKGDTWLHLAVRQNLRAVALKIVERGRAAVAAVQNEIGETALDMALRLWATASRAAVGVDAGPSKL